MHNENAFELKERTMEIPISLPYMEDENDFRSTNTLFEKNGKFFRAIKQKYNNETLHVIYVIDTAKNNLDLTIKNWISSLVQDELPGSGHNSFLFKIFFKDYLTPVSSLMFGYWDNGEIQFGDCLFLTYSNQYPEIISPPPQRFG